MQGLTTPSGSIYVKVTDNCPCVQYDITTGKETGVNAPCCGDVNHFDLSYFAFEKIAHPVRLHALMLACPVRRACLYRTWSRPASQAGRRL